ncbi:MAG: hypothetical protein UX91_C0007G0057 [Candidatus Amesbacteria bacterium GW2011_GWB1_47_19]|nr:MAG: hypothetical protein UW51_C0006G0122 [Candidatus Amesbacteria bacterium GW2011_GWA1_44_24]KKU31841.1 MAG: hypothetical protein UX46_C0002G0057 [Candidatus Amesbacteria bacterium GW2011_GWC1_46_24]KKU66777.1 MAG: hypothetical protein UX91_C0007G0057 [Candidatus Amesbacteria bacterium GW2011_GWB1_47_19]OGD05929.1 MAG: hypothetical protein A2379_00125 [Candidatus Amesbacteria bacterium RIFOXYB1_FULL_47_13]HBC73142.1 hypothetical protein [Candidatus Amesbacteria bacterium]
MAVKKSNKETSDKMAEVKWPKKSEKWMNLGWSLLLLGGLAHMLPEQMAPLLKWSLYGISLQMAVGVLSVIVALYYLLGEEE